MVNHFHLETVDITNSEILSKLMHLLCTAYSMYFNRKYRKNGHVFQGRYKTRTITSISDLVHISRYIHQNPVELFSSKRWSEVIKLAREYEYSSYSMLLRQGKMLSQSNLPAFLNPELLDFFGKNISSFKDFTESPIPKWDKKYYLSIVN